MISKKPDTNVNQTETMCWSNVPDGWVQGHGLAIYSKSSFTFGPCIETRDVEATVFSVQQRPDFMIVFIYKSPKVSSKALLDLLQHIQTKYVKSTKALLLGDFNIDWISESFEKHALRKVYCRYRRCCRYCWYHWWCYICCCCYCFSYCNSRLVFFEFVVTLFPHFSNCDKRF